MTDEAKPTPEEESRVNADTAPEQEQPTVPEPEDDLRDIPLPPASFEFLVLSLRSQAEMHLGLLHFGEEKNRPKPNLPLARHAIDLLAVIQDKTKGNLSLDESRLIENSLTELRFRFVQASESGKQ